MPERGNPNLARRQRLGKELRRLRERTTGMTGDEATTHLGWASVRTDILHDAEFGFYAA